jgi:hypothetical protein
MRRVIVGSGGYRVVAVGAVWSLRHLRAPQVILNPPYAALRHLSTFGGWSKLLQKTTLPKRAFTTNGVWLALQIQRFRCA